MCIRRAQVNNIIMPCSADYNRRVVQITFYGNLSTASPHPTLHAHITSSVSIPANDAVPSVHSVYSVSGRHVGYVFTLGSFSIEVYAAFDSNGLVGYELSQWEPRFLYATRWK